jgi:hypothetical protein
MRWECAVCAKSWRLDARLPHDDDQTLPAASEIRGRLYNRLKKAPEANLKQNAPIRQNGGSDETAERLAARAAAAFSDF